MLPIRLEQAERKVVRHAIDQPRLAGLLEGAEHQCLPLATAVNAAVGVAHNRKRVDVTADRVREHVVMLDRMQRDAHAGACRQLRSPHASAQNDGLGLDVPRRGAHPGRAPAPLEQRRDPDTFDDERAESPRLARDCPHQGEGLDDAVVGEPDAAHDVVEPCQGPSFSRFAAPDLMDLDTEAPSHESGPPQLHNPFLGPRQGQTARLPPAGLQAAVACDPFIQGGTSIVQSCQARGRAHPPHRAGGMPRGSGAELVLLQDYHAGRAQLRQLVSERDPGHATADDHDPRRRRKRLVSQRVARCRSG